MNTDKQLLELAAKAAGMTVTGGYGEYGDIEVGGEYWLTVEPQGENVGWNPLTDDGDALRLFVLMCVRVGTFKMLHRTLKALRNEKGRHDDPYSGVRRAITCAASGEY